MRHEGAPARYSSFMKLPLCVRPARGARRRDGLNYPTDFEIVRRSKVSA